MQSRHFVVSVYSNAPAELAWHSSGVRDLAFKATGAECVVTEIAPNIYVGSAMEKQVAEAMTREMVK